VQVRTSASGTGPRHGTQGHLGPDGATTQVRGPLKVDRLYYADKGLDKPLTVARIHVIRGHIAAARAALLTKPLRPEKMS